MKVEYHSNNSGGHWWLSDADWKKLEKAGWLVQWGGEFFCSSEKNSWNRRPDGFDCGKGNDCKGHQVRKSFKEVTKDDRWLGAAAKEATLTCETPADAMKSFEDATGQKVTDEGCNCCGCPHSFHWDDGGYASGEDCLQYLYPGKKIPKDLREAIENE